MLASKGASGPLRVAAIVPDGNFDRVVNSPLLDTKMIDAHDLDAAADVIASRVRVLDSTLGDIAVAPRPRLFGAEGWVDGSRRFVGRLAEMWSVHDQLHETTSQTNVGTAGRGVALVAGYGGAGKSLMAAEYAHIFAAAYPGGVCWLNANGNQASDVPDAGNPGSPQQSPGSDRATSADAEWIRQAEALGVDIEGLSSADIGAAVRSWLRVARRAWLWIVDDLPSGLAPADRDVWLCPEPNVWNLVTTRDSNSDLLTVEIGALDQTSAVSLLLPAGSDGATLDGSVLDDALAIVELLGAHALAIDVTARACAASGESLAQVRQRL